jgi:glycosyltransferase involved in cell wall biosynthesis
VAFHDYGRSEETGHPGFGVTEVADAFGIAGRVGHLAWGFVPGASERPSDGRTLTIVGLPYQADGSGYHRIYLPFQNMERQSRHVVAVPAPGRRIPIPAVAELEEVDVLVMQRPAHNMGAKVFERYGGHVARVYETDDDILTMETSNNAFATEPRALESVRRCLRLAELVTVSTPYLAELYAPFNSNIAVLPNYVKASLLDMPVKAHDRVTIGWQGGISHLVDLCAVQDPLREVLDAHPDADMHWIGVDYSPLVRRPCRFTPWSDDVGDYYKAMDFDIAIAPLADVPFNRAKSYLKALDAAARGIPVIAQDMEPYREFVEDGVTGYLVRSDADWVKRLTELINDGGARREMGAAAKKLAADYTMEGNWERWQTAYERAAG